MRRPLRHPTDTRAAISRMLAQHGQLLGRAIIRSMLRGNAPAVATLLRISQARRSQQPPQPQEAA
jgi:hypothetical protein